MENAGWPDRIDLGGQGTPGGKALIRRHHHPLPLVRRDDGVAIETTRLPVRVNDVRSKGDIAAPRIGQHTDALRREFGI